MNIKRDWSTPITAGAFILMAVTGVLMFFHLDTGLNKETHEWLGWAMIGGVTLHVISNWRAFKGHLGKRLGQSLMGVFVILLALSFLPLGEEKRGGGGPPFMAPVKALAALPLTSLATVAQTTPEALQAQLREAGFQVASSNQSVRDVVGPDTRRQVDVVVQLFQ